MSVLTTGRHAARRQVARLVVGGVPAVMRCAPVRAAIGRAWPQLGAYYASPATQRLSARDHTQQPARNLTFYAGLRERLAASGVPVEDAAVDLADFEAWLADYAELRDYYRGIAGSPWVEKCLEHYLAARWLGIAPGDTAVDVGAQRSPWAEILAARGVRSYRLDLSYPAGIHGRDIGADAGATRLPDGFCTVLTAHCSYEAFAGDSDVRFVREAGRIL
ncbi:MAG: hypothetical protein IT340_13975, partial [Chloroflexi bacterium]|nr:hypothetical protein [Chloroflexota bacterium]